MSYPKWIYSASGEARLISASGAGRPSGVWYDSPAEALAGTDIAPNADTQTLILLASTQSASTLTIRNPTGTPRNGQALTMRIQSTNAQTFSWGSQYRGSSDAGLPTATTGSSKTDYLGFEWNATDATWDLLAKNFGF